MHKPLEASKPTRDSPDTASRLLTTMASPLGARWFWDDARVVLEVGGNALAHAMSRDGSSGGTIRMAVITKEGVERFFVPGDQLPKLEDTV
uniref:FGENESH: predicted gene_5.112 protein n=1 Tax=Rhodotorula toruloides TaxID=5286 RepID=A0A0K3CHL6_RHOTO